MSLTLKKGSKPNYGSKDFIPSKNYKDYTWWVPGADGKPTDPYELIREYKIYRGGKEQKTLISPSVLLNLSYCYYSVVVKLEQEYFISNFTTSKKS